MKERFVQGAAAAGIYTFSAALAGVTQLRLVVHYLPPSTAGIWTLFVTCSTYIALLDLGLTPTVGRELSLISGCRPDGAGGLDASDAIATLLRTVTVCTRYLAAAALVISLAVGAAVFVGSTRAGHDHSTMFAWTMFSLGSASNLLGGAAFSGLFGLGYVADEKIIRSFSLIAGALMVWLFLSLGWGLPGAATAWALQGLLARGLALWRLRRLAGAVALQPAKVNWKLARALSLPSLKLAGIQVASVAILQSANPIIAARIGTAAIPSYESVSRISLTMMTFALLVVSASTPFLSMAYAAGDLSGVRRMLSRNVRLGMATIIVPCAFVAVYGDRLVTLWLGPGVFPGFPVLWVLLGVVLLEVHHVIYASAVMATGRIIFVHAAVLSGAMNLLLAFFLAPRFGLLGIALAASVSQLTTNNWYAPFRAIRLFKLSVRENLSRLVLPCLLLLALELAVVTSLRRLSSFQAQTIAGLAACLLVSVAAGAALSGLLCTEAVERATLYAACRRRLLRP